MRSAQHTCRLAFLVGLLLISLPVLGQSQSSPSPDETSEVPTTGKISGRLINENGQPLSGAAVFIRAYGPPGPSYVTTTARDGSFESSSLDRRAYLINASAPGYTTQPRDPDSTQSTYYRIGDSITIVLLKGGVITGSVTNSGAEPVVGVRVRAQMIRDGNGQPSRYGATIRDRLTDDRGIYRIYGLPTGTYIVMAGGGGVASRRI